MAEDECIEKVIDKDQFNHPIKQGDVLEIRFDAGKLISIPLYDETEKRREHAKDLLDRYRIKKDKDKECPLASYG